AKSAVAYLRTSSAANVGPDKDSDKRQVTAFAKRAGFTLVGEYYDKAVSVVSMSVQALGKCCSGWQRTVQRPSLWSRRIASPVTLQSSSLDTTCSRVSASRSFLHRHRTSSSRTRPLRSYCARC